MPGEDRANQQNGGTGGEASGGDKLTTIATSIDAIKGVVGDLVTKVSDIERSVQERQDLAEIMRFNRPPEEEEDLSQFERKPAQAAAQPNDVVAVASKLEATLKKSLDSVNRRIDDIAAKFEVKQLEMSKPDFNTKIRPVAYQISKEPGMSSLSVEQITSIAEGRLAQKQVGELSKQLEDMKAQIEDLQVRAVGDKPGMFVGIEEPPKKMSPAEAFEDAYKKSGAARLIR